MQNAKVYVLKAGKKIYSKLVKTNAEVDRRIDRDPDSVSRKIYHALTNSEPSMIARFGANELSCIVNYLGITKSRGRYLSYMKGDSSAWWWEDSVVDQMHRCAGFFPPDERSLTKFAELMLKEIPNTDVLGSWLDEERYLDSLLTDVKKVRFLFLDPFWSKVPWTRALEGKKVLVVHPFAETIQRQYYKREKLFKDNLLPEFNLITIKAVQTIAGNESGFKDWFSALDHMKAQIDNVDYDICLIGCGAYGFPLAAHVKRMGKKGFHLGGSLQLLFGIRGKRWEDPNYSSYDYPGLVNESWVKPDETEKPDGVSTVENACYW